MENKESQEKKKGPTVEELQAQIKELKALKAPPEKKQKSEYDKLKEPIKGRFKNVESPGLPMSCVMKLDKSTPLKNWSFQDGEIYEVPRWVAQRLNNECYTRELVFTDGSDASGKAIGKKKHRFAFEPLEY